MEHWKPVLGYEGSYEVSDMGRVRSVDRFIDFADGRRRFYAARFLNFKTHEAGYPLVSLSRASDTYWRLVHQLVMEAFEGPCPAGKEVCHNNGIPTDARFSNLRYDTRKANHADMRVHGTLPQGGAHHSAIYGDEVVVAVRAASGTITEIAAAHRISRTHAWNIRNSKRRASSCSL